MSSSERKEKRQRHATERLKESGLPPETGMSRRARRVLGIAVASLVTYVVLRFIVDLNILFSALAAIGIITALLAVKGIPRD